MKKIPQSRGKTPHTRKKHQQIGKTQQKTNKIEKKKQINEQNLLKNFKKKFPAPKKSLK